MQALQIKLNQAHVPQRSSFSAHPILSSTSRCFPRLWMLLVACLCAPSLFASVSGSPRIRVLAAENVYGGLAAEIGGPYVSVTSILYNPMQDPHLFSASPRLAQAIWQADIVIYNGLGYDDWITPLLPTRAAASPTVISAAALLRRQTGDNPHLWYDPDLMPAFSEALTQAFAQRDPIHTTYYAQRLRNFQHRHLSWQRQLEHFRARFQGVEVIATEPVAGYLTTHLKLHMLGESFQRQIMNGGEPSFSELRDFETALRTGRAKALLYNAQVTTPLTQQLLALANRLQIPVVGLTETQPPGVDYLSWMQAQLAALAQALSQNAHPPLATRHAPNQTGAYTAQSSARQS